MYPIRNQNHSIQQQGLLREYLFIWTLFALFAFLQLLNWPGACTLSCSSFCLAVVIGFKTEVKYQKLVISLFSCISRFCPIVRQVFAEVRKLFYLFNGRSGFGLASQTITNFLLVLDLQVGALSQPTVLIFLINDFLFGSCNLLPLRFSLLRALGLACSLSYYSQHYSLTVSQWLSPYFLDSAFLALSLQLEQTILLIQNLCALGFYLILIAIFLLFRISCQSNFQGPCFLINQYSDNTSGMKGSTGYIIQKSTLHFATLKQQLTKARSLLKEIINRSSSIFSSTKAYDRYFIKGKILLWLARPVKFLLNQPKLGILSILLFNMSQNLSFRLTSYVILFKVLWLILGHESISSGYTQSRIRILLARTDNLQKEQAFYKTAGQRLLFVQRLNWICISLNWLSNTDLSCLKAQNTDPTTSPFYMVTYSNQLQCRFQISFRSQVIAGFSYSSATQNQNHGIISCQLL